MPMHAWILTLRQSTIITERIAAIHGYMQRFLKHRESLTKGWSVVSVLQRTNSETAGEIEVYNKKTLDLE